MKFFRFGKKTEKREIKISQKLGDVLFSRSTATPTVDEESARRIATVGACARVLRESVAVLPFILYRRLDEGKERADDHPLFSLFGFEPAPGWTRFRWFETFMDCLIFRGNFYATIEQTNGGQITALRPLHPDSVQVIQRGLEHFYIVTDVERRSVVFNRSEIFHVAYNPPPDKVKGVSVITHHAEQIGIAAALDTFAGKYFANGATPSGILEYPEVLDDEAYKRIRQSWDATHAGANNAHKVLILEDGLKFNALSMSNEDSQFLESRKYQRTEICSIFGVPPHMIGDLERATFSNIEHQRLSFYGDTVQPWLTRLSEEVNRQLLLPDERPTLFFEFLVEARLRADTKARFEAYQLALQNGIMNIDEARARENLNPLPNGVGKTHYRPLNWGEVGKPNEPNQQSDQGQTQDGTD